MSNEELSETMLSELKAYADWEEKVVPAFREKHGLEEGKTYDVKENDKVVLVVTPTEMGVVFGAQSPKFPNTFTKEIPALATIKMHFTSARSIKAKLLAIKTTPDSYTFSEREAKVRGRSASGIAPNLELGPVDSYV